MDPYDAGSGEPLVEARRICRRRAYGLEWRLGGRVYVIGGGPTPGLSVSGVNESITP